MSNIEVFNIETSFIQQAITGMRFALKSAKHSDSKVYNNGFEIGDKDKALALKLIKAGTSHSKFIQVNFTVKAPLYWWKHFATYHFADSLSESTMHTLMKRQLDKNDFAKDTDEDIIAIVNENIYLGKFEEAVNNLPCSFLQSRMISTNYACLRNMYFQRRNHKLQEWHDFFEELLPHLPENIFIIAEKGKSDE